MDNSKNYITSNYRTLDVLKERARSMRLNPTYGEKIAWIILRKKGLGVKFRRQHIMENFIVDFVCLEIQLVIEVDGDIHDETKEYDEWRSGILESIGFKVVRISNDELMENGKLSQERLQGCVNDRVREVERGV